VTGSSPARATTRPGHVAAAPLPEEKGVYGAIMPNGQDGIVERARQVRGHFDPIVEEIFREGVRRAGDGERLCVDYLSEALLAVDGGFVARKLCPWRIDVGVMARALREDGRNRGTGRDHVGVATVAWLLSDLASVCTSVSSQQLFVAILLEERNALAHFLRSAAIDLADLIRQCFPFLQSALRLTTRRPPDELRQIVEPVADEVLRGLLSQAPLPYRRARLRTVTPDSPRGPGARRYDPRLTQAEQRTQADWARQRQQLVQAQQRVRDEWELRRRRLVQAREQVCAEWQIQLRRGREQANRLAQEWEIQLRRGQEWAARLARERQLARRKSWSEAERTARGWLAKLVPDQSEVYEREGCLVVWSTAHRGRSYRIRERGFTEVCENGRRAWRSCLQVREPRIPVTDRVIAEYFLIRGDEERYLRTAIRHPV